MLVLIYLLGLVAWAVPTVAAVWFLLAFREIHREIRTIRRYLKEIHERMPRQ